MSAKDAGSISDSEDPDLTPSEQSNLGLHCLARPTYPKTWDHNGI